MASPRRAPGPQGQSGAQYVRTGTPQMEVIPSMADLEASAVIATPAVDGPDQGQPEAASEPVQEPVPAAPAAAPAQPEVAPVAPAPADPLMSKWEQMTPEQRAESWRNSQQLIGKHGEELGVLRKAVDRFASMPPVPAPPPAPPAPVEPKINFEDASALVTELLTNPNKVFATLEERAEARVLGKLKKTSIEEQMQERRNRDLPKLAQSAEAQEWLARVPKKLIEEADSDPQMWDFLMSQAPINRTASPAAAPQPAAPRAPVVLGTAAAPSAAAKPLQTAKVWTRREIAELYMNKQEEYALRADEIAAAYRENRVRD